MSTEADGPSDAAVAALADRLRPGHLVALADGAGAATTLLPALARAARRVGGVRLLTGWLLGPVDDDDLAAFAEVRTVMGGYGLRRAVRSGRARYVPARLGTVPTLLRGPLRPDLVVAALRPGSTGLAHGSEVGWAAAAMATGCPVVAQVNHGLPRASALPDVPRHRVVVVEEVDRPPVPLAPPADPDAATAALAARVAALVPEGASIQVGPGAIGEAVLAALDVPVHVDSGVLVDGVAGLDRRGLLRGAPVAAYLAGRDVYAWADGRPVLHGVEHTHDLARLARSPLVAVNTALEVDERGQVNVEAAGGDPVAGIGGHADYALAASRSPGLSVIALPTHRGGRRTLVPALDPPTSTARSDVDVVATERGVVDLRGRSDAERGELLRALWA